MNDQNETELKEKQTHFKIQIVCSGARSIEHKGKLNNCSKNKMKIIRES